MNSRVLAVNHGTTATKIAVYDDEKAIFTETISHDPDKVVSFGGIIQQYQNTNGVKN